MASMANQLKVEFVDNSATQYDCNASLIDYGAGEGNGQLYLGDRYSCSMVQLKARKCRTVVSCCIDMHGFAKEAEVNYLKIDPDDEDNNHFDEAFEFIDANLSKNKNVVVYCENGFSKSAVILCYFLMKKRSISLGQSYNILQKCRGALRLPPRLVKLLMQAEKTLRGTNSIKLEGKVVTVLPVSTANMRLFLHFDINKSIIMSDAGSGRSMEQTLSSLLSECTWGLCEEKDLSGRSADDWKVCHPHPRSTAPQEGAITLGTYLEDHTLVPKKEQTKIKRAYTTPGGMGECFKVYHDQLDSALRTNCDASAVRDLPYLAGGYYHIIPSFFRLVEYLAEQDVEFNILFRTFGLDIHNVCDDFNLFCTGKHPAYVPSRLLDGSDACFPKDLRIRLPYFHGRLSHTGPGSEGLHMTHTTVDKVDEVVSGAEEVYRVIMQEWFDIDCVANSTAAGTARSEGHEQLKQHTHCAAIQDDFQWWHTVNNESEDSGKLLLVDTSATGQDDVTSTKERLIQVFFDDNIERDRAHIVDVRDCHTYAPVPFAQAAGRFLRRVEPFQAIMDREYYVREVQEVLRLHNL